MEIWLIRHGTTKPNLEGRIQGQRDYPLSKQGKREIGKLALRLKDIKIDAFYSSPLSRARETAEALLRENHDHEAQRVELQVLPHLIEYGWGSLEGYTWEEIKAANPRYYAQLKRDFWSVPVKGREDKSHFLRRIKEVLTEIWSSFRASERVVVVSHGRFINAFITYALGLPWEGKWPFSAAPASVSVMKSDATPNSFKLHLFNDRCHLKENFY